MHSILNEIISEKRKTVESAKRILPLDKIKNSLKGSIGSGRFGKALSYTGRTNIIAELKKASPSAGLICKDFDPAGIAADYKTGAAAAISVLTEEKFFLGDPAFVAEAAKASGLPVLRKDFIVDIYQVAESALIGADAVLLIAAALSKDELRSFCDEALSVGIEALVEVHDEKELESALSCGAGIIGINNRNLNDFKVALDVSERLIPLIPEDRIVVVESGIKSRKDIDRLKTAGADAFLIGETLMKSGDRINTIKEFAR